MDVPVSYRERGRWVWNWSTVKHIFFVLLYLLVIQVNVYLFGLNLDDGDNSLHSLDSYGQAVERHSYQPAQDESCPGGGGARHYRTPHGTLFKARALQYSLEPEVDILSDDDWIIHLDEETLLTEDAVVGIINFVSEGRHHFGQGVITYSRGHIVNWLTTLADSVRVGVDYGSLRFTLKVLHKPFFSWKGSFIVANAAAEKKVSFDHGPESSIAEDCFFAMVAYQLGYSFGFVEGEMLEKSTFTLKDFVHQRKRWMRGIFLTASSSKLPVRYKMGPILMTLAAFFLPLTSLNIPLGLLCPIPVKPSLNIVCAFIASTFEFLFILGTCKSFSVRRYGVLRHCLLVVATLGCSFFILIFENIASIMAFWMPSETEFYVVKKELNFRDRQSIV
ncbi:hypothetical protein BaRGS_00004946 [Batillaria attramentaria]|uniref:Glycosyltransferase 2-like domain-containing protein n=1 Tax=Batillaria attramentaria TaxID=370345 RepID=A0ABD0LXH8_9CAEN